MKLEQNQDYLLEINGKSCKAKLVKIQTYPASSMPPDYLFTALEGEEPLLTQDNGYFPIPAFMINMMEITLLNEDGNVPEVSEITKDEQLHKHFLSLIERLNNTPLLDSVDNIFEELDKLTFNEEQETIFKETLTERIEALHKIKREL